MTTATPASPRTLQPEELALIAKAQTGDMGAFDILYNQYSSRVFRFVVFRVRNRHLAEDLTADTFLHALRRIDTWACRGGRDLGAWLCRIAQNVIIDHSRLARHRHELGGFEEYWEDLDAIDHTPEGNPEEAAIGHDLLSILGANINKLPPEQKTCVMLRYIHGFSVAETCQAMNKNASAVKGLTFRALRNLGRLLPEGLT